MAKRYLTTEPAFIGGSLLAAGSIVTEDELTGDPSDHLVEIDAKGNPKTDDGADRLRGLGVSAEPIEMSPVAPHAPNPTQPQGLPPHGVGEVMPAGEFVPGDGVESNEAAAARAKQAAKAKK